MNLALALALAAPSAWAANAFLTYRFMPTQVVGPARVVFHHPIQHVPVLMEFAEGRPPDTRRILGTRTTDDDRVQHVALTNDLLPVLTPSLEHQANIWGLTLAPVRADRTLTVTLVRASVDELNQAVGATYKGNATLEGALRDAGGTELWSGAATGDTSRYGKAASADNACEVLSDAVVEAWAHLLGDAGLQAAWVGSLARAAAAPAPAVPVVVAAPPAAHAEPAAVLTPEALLAELQELQGAGFGAETLQQYVVARALTRPLGASELVAWKKAGIPESVVQRAMVMPVR